MRAVKLTEDEAGLFEYMRKQQAVKRAKRLHPLVRAVQALEAEIMAKRKEIARVEAGGAFPKCTCDQQWTNPRCPAVVKGYSCHAW